MTDEELAKKKMDIQRKSFFVLAVLWFLMAIVRDDYKTVYIGLGVIFFSLYVSAGRKRKGNED